MVLLFPLFRGKQHFIAYLNNLKSVDLQGWKDGLLVKSTRSIIMRTCVWISAPVQQARYPPKLPVPQLQGGLEVIEYGSGLLPNILAET